MFSRLISPANLFFRVLKPLTLGLLLALSAPAFATEKTAAPTPEVSAQNNAKNSAEQPEEAPKPLPNTVFLCHQGKEVIYTNTRLNPACQSITLNPPKAMKAPPKIAGQMPGKTPNPAPNVASVNPSGLPSISASAQKERDTDRRRILEDELSSEQKSLDLAKKELAQQATRAAGSEKNYQKRVEALQPFKEKVALHERNVSALNKEISAFSGKK